jgi:hypothetical protein
MSMPTTAAASVRIGLLRARQGGSMGRANDARVCRRREQPTYAARMVASGPPRRSWPPTLVGSLPMGFPARGSSAASTARARQRQHRRDQRRPRARDALVSSSPSRSTSRRASGRSCSARGLRGGGGAASGPTRRASRRDRRASSATSPDLAPLSRGARGWRRRPASSPRSRGAGAIAFVAWLVVTGRPATSLASLVAGLSCRSPPRAPARRPRATTRAAACSTST